MNANERLRYAGSDFHQSWKAHTTALRAVEIVSSCSPEQEPGVSAKSIREIQIASGLTADDWQLLLHDIEGMRERAFFALRKNCLLGVCSSFEIFAKTVAAALSYEPGWRGLPADKRLQQETDGDFYSRFLAWDKKWIRGKEKFLRETFCWLLPNTEAQVAEIFWLRNQFTHNANIAKEDKTLPLIDATFCKGEPISLDSGPLRKCVEFLKGIENEVSNEFRHEELF